MMSKIYVLSIGINNYASPVNKLQGCLNNVAALKMYLFDIFDKDRICFETLTDSEATRKNIIQQFRSHLGRASSDDVVLFHKPIPLILKLR